MKIKIGPIPEVEGSGIPGVDGEYDLDGGFTARELHEIKKATGLRGGEVQEAAEAGDFDVMMAFTMIALQRNGTPERMDLVWDAPIDSYVLELDTSDDEAEAAKAEADALPPEPVPVTEPSIEPSSDGESNGSGPTFNELSEESRAALLKFSGAAA